MIKFFFKLIGLSVMPVFYISALVGLLLMGQQIFVENDLSLKTPFVLLGNAKDWAETTLQEWILEDKEKAVLELPQPLSVKEQSVAADKMREAGVAEDEVDRFVQASDSERQRYREEIATLNAEIDSDLPELIGRISRHAARQRRSHYRESSRMTRRLSDVISRRTTVPSEQVPASVSPADQQAVADTAGALLTAVNASRYSDAGSVCDANLRSMLTEDDWAAFSIGLPGSVWSDGYDIIVEAADTVLAEADGIPMFELTRSHSSAWQVTELYVATVPE